MPRLYGHLPSVSRSLSGTSDLNSTVILFSLTGVPSGETSGSGSGLSFSSMNSICTLLSCSALLGLLLLLEGFTGGLVLVTVLGDEGLPLLDLRLGLLLLGGTVFLGDGFQGLLAFVPVLPERDLLVLVPVLLGLDLLLLGFGHLFMPGCSLRLIFLRHFEHLGMSSRNLTKIRDTR